MSAAEAVRQAIVGAAAGERDADQCVGRDTVVDADDGAVHVRRPIVASDQGVTGGVALAAIGCGPDAPAAGIGCGFGRRLESQCLGNQRTWWRRRVAAGVGERIAHQPTGTNSSPECPPARQRYRPARRAAQRIRQSGRRQVEEAQERRRQRDAATDRVIEPGCDREIIGRGRGWQQRCRRAGTR